MMAGMRSKFDPPPPRWGTWLPILALHGLALFWWLQMTLPRGAERSSQTLWMMLSVPSERTVPEAAPASVPTRSHRFVMRQQSARSAANATTAGAWPESKTSGTREAPPAPSAPESLATSRATTAAPSDLATTALRDLARVDKDLRQAFRELPRRETTSAQSRLGSAIAAAGVESRLAPSYQEHSYPGGRRIVKVSSAAGTYCVIQEGAGANDGLDHLQTGNGLKTISCGNLFD